MKKDKDRIDKFNIEVSVLKRNKQLKCDCCNGTGYVEGEHYDDIQGCNTCLGRGTF